MNREKTIQLVQCLLKLGVKEVCLAPGGRCAPIVDLLTQQSPFKIYSHFDERTAGFFALGRMKTHKSPVPVITTSGTAVAELLPAMIEAYYSGLPLIALSADRPPHYRNIGAPQSIEQVNIFGVYSRSSYDLQTSEFSEIFEKKIEYPAHINICFDEPLIDGEKETINWNIPSDNEGLIQDRENRFEADLPGHEIIKDFIFKLKKPLIMVGALPDDCLSEMEFFLLDLQAPIFAEGHSGLRESKKISEWLVRTGDPFLKKIDFDGVLRIGGVPTTRYWRDLESEKSKLPTLSISSEPFRGVSHGDLVVANPIKGYFKNLNLSSNWNRREWECLRDQEDSYFLKIQEILLEEPLSEPSFFRHLSSQVPDSAQIYVGNSMPIRQWDLFSQREMQHRIEANRGANGIDGQISTFLGYAAPKVQNWGIFGDLTALYDLNSFWSLKELTHHDIKIVIVNNFGGKIFERMFESPLFQNNHRINFEHWAKFWRIEFQEIIDPYEEISADKQSLIEVKPDKTSTETFWKKYKTLWLN